MNDLGRQLQWIDSRGSDMRIQLTELCNINSHSYNVAGVERVLDLVQARLAPLAHEVKRIPVPPAKSYDDRGQAIESPLATCLLATKRADAKVRILLNIHADTVYPPTSPFQSVGEIGANRLNGPGVIDAKGGIIVLLTALEAFEQSPLAERIGWEVIINSDEEVGSPGSSALLDEAAKRNHYGLLFEPALASGGLVSQRKGSGNYTIVVRGRAAHAGRDFANGRNAVVAASEIAVRIHEANAGFDGATINVGKITGGGAANIVPDLATLMLNGRASVPEDVKRIEDAIFHAQLAVAMREGYSVQTFGRFTSKPKMLDPKSQELLELILSAGKSIGLQLTHGASGGASDGNRLAAAGLPNIDSLGPRGGEMHSEREFVEIDSLVERAKLSFVVLAQLAENAEGHG